MSSEAFIVAISISIIIAFVDFLAWLWIVRRITELRSAQVSSDRSREFWVENMRDRISSDELKISALRLDAAEDRARVGQLAKRLGFEYNEIETRGWKRIGGPEAGE